jgi:hypothetical protein
VQEKVAALAEMAIDFAPMQKPASFNLEQGTLFVQLGARVFQSPS